MTKKNNETTTIDKKLFNTLNSVVDSSNVFSNKRIELATLLSEIQMSNLKLLKVNREDNHHIMDSSLNEWIEKIYNKFLKPYFEQKDFKTFRSTKRSHFEAIKDVALVVQFLTGNFCNASSDVKLIPLCKIVQGNDNQKKIVEYNSSEGVYYDKDTNWKLYIRNSSLSLVNQKIKDRINIEGDTYNAVMKNFNPILLNISMKDLISMSKQVINFAVVGKEGDKTWQTDTLKIFDKLTSDFEAKLTDDDVESIFKGEQSTQKVFDAVTGYIKLCASRKQFDEIFELVEDIHSCIENLTKTNKDLKAHIDKNQNIFAYQKGLQDNLKHQLISSGLKLVA